MEAAQLGSLVAFLHPVQQVFVENNGVERLS